MKQTKSLDNLTKESPSIKSHVLKYKRTAFPIYQFEQKKQDEKRKIDYLLYRKLDSLLQNDIFILMPKEAENQKTFSPTEDLKFQKKIDNQISQNIPLRLPDIKSQNPKQNNQAEIAQKVFDLEIQKGLKKRNNLFEKLKKWGAGDVLEFKSPEMKIENQEGFLSVYHAAV